MTHETADDTTEAAQRDFARALFAPDEPDETAEPDEQQKPPGYVAREGNTPKPPAGDGMREFTRNLFDRDPNS